LWRKRLLQETLPVLLFTILAFLVMGYHPGFEDDGIYLTAVKAQLNPSLYPYNSDFFRLQMQATMFDGWMAHSSASPAFLLPGLSCCGSRQRSFSFFGPAAGSLRTSL